MERSLTDEEVNSLQVGGGGEIDVCVGGEV